MTTNARQNGYAAPAGGYKGQHMLKPSTFLEVCLCLQMVMLVYKV
jgi:hypothetical protein